MVLTLLFLASYLLGSIPFSVVIGKLFFGVDVRLQGSGNPGATNTMRVLGKKAGFAVLLLDMGKGALAVLLAYLISMKFDITTNSLSLSDCKTICGGLAILGHVYSPFLKFKGGKGVATAMGTVLALQPLIGLIMILTFTLILILFKYVSLGSIIAAGLYPLLCYLLLPAPGLILYLFSISLALLIIIKHRENIKRLLAGNENRFSLKSKK